MYNTVSKHSEIMGMDMSKLKWVKTIILYGVVVFYSLLLLKILFLSRVSFSELFVGVRTAFESVNLIPFSSIGGYIFGDAEGVGRFAFGNIIGNIVIFVPLGAFLPLFKKDKRVLVNFLIISGTSLLVELIQGLLAIGTFDIDDLILNSLGGLVGILAYKGLATIFKDDKKVSTVIEILPVILYLLFYIQMRF